MKKPGRSTLWRAGVAVLALCLVGSRVAAAQDEVPLPPPIPFEPEVPTAKAEFDALSAEMRTAQNERRKAFAERPEGDAAAGWRAPPRVEPGFQERFAEEAETYAGTDDAVQFLMTVASLGRYADKDLAVAAMETLSTTHLRSEWLYGLTFTLMYGTHAFGEDHVINMATRIADGTPHATVKSAMLYLRGSVIQRRGPETAEEADAAIADLRAAAAAAPESRYSKLANGSIFELENLQVGMPAPEIEGNDLDGVAFKLSDYRGKVVVLDFWGDW